MKLGVFTTLLSNLPLEKALQYFKSLGIEMVEIGCGGYPGNAHANPDVLLSDAKALDEFKGLIREYDMGISALSCHSNPVHPNKAEAKAADETIRKTMIPTQLCQVKSNIGYAPEFGIFEVGRVVSGMTDDNMCIENKILGITLYKKGLNVRELYFKLKGIIEVLADEAQVTEYALYELQFLE